MVAILSISFVLSVIIIAYMLRTRGLSRHFSRTGAFLIGLLYAAFLTPLTALMVFIACFWVADSFMTTNVVGHTTGDEVMHMAIDRRVSAQPFCLIRGDSGRLLNISSVRYKKGTPFVEENRSDCVLRTYYRLEYATKNWQWYVHAGDVYKPWRVPVRYELHVPHGAIVDEDSLRAAHWTWE